MNIEIADWIFLGLLVFFIIKVSIRGFISEFFSKAAVIFGALIAVLFYKVFTPVISKMLGPKSLSALIAFLILFLSAYLVIKLLEVLLGSLFSNQSLRSLDRALGFFLGIIEGILVIAVLLIIIHIQPVINPEQILGKSIFAKILSPFIFNIGTIL